jgi:hypothetical protein
MGESEKPKIFCWVNSGVETEWQIVVAMAEDGTSLASHCSSSEHWAKHDIGITSDRKHEKYRAHYPDGYEIVWVDDAEVMSHPGILAAIEAKRAKAAAVVSEVQT